MNYFAGEYDVAVVGAGHAGIEAALAAARLGCKTAIFTINMDAVGNCPCNPSIGGTAKDISSVRLTHSAVKWERLPMNVFCSPECLTGGKGPAVHSLRAQIDRRKYSSVMKHKIELQKISTFVRLKLRILKRRRAVIILLQECLPYLSARPLLLQRVHISAAEFLSVRFHMKAVPTEYFPPHFSVQALKNSVCL